VDKLKSIWGFLSGKKTVIGAILKGLADVAIAAGYPDIAGIIDQFGNVFVVIGLVHKVEKKAVA